MVVIFEFLGTEPIENVITCMNFKADKVVYFCYHETKQKLEKSTNQFLKKYCGVENTVYHTLPKDNLDSTLKTMRSAIEYELGQSNKIFFDITGGESLILVAFGMLASQYNIPIHHYDVRKDKLIELGATSNKSLTKTVPARKIKFTLNSYIELRDGVINDSLQKEMKTGLEEHTDDVARLWLVANQHAEYWNPLSNFFRANFKPSNDLFVNVSAKKVLAALETSKSKLKRTAKLNELLDLLEKAGAINDLVYENGRYQFRYRNKFIKDCLWDGGSILEIYVYLQEKDKSDDCRIGVHIDWDGVEGSENGDVLNEIDVLVLKGNVPTFISCKSGSMDGDKPLPALYELEAVTKRFGGKYAKKELAVLNLPGDAYLARAEEMGIEIRCDKKQ